MVPSQAKGLRILAPAPDARPSRVTDVAVRPAKRISNACDACKKRKTRCRGDHPCDKCTQAGTECLFARGVDRRKKFALHNTEEELNAIRLLLDQLVAAFDSGNKTDIQRLIDIARNKSNTKNDAKLHKWCSLQDLQSQLRFYEQLTHNLSVKFGTDVSNYIAHSLKNPSFGSLPP
ncbi:Zn(II)2Cys6 transcription factor domain-containing protein [Aspergillus luchuensis]|uniref:Zn(2)-C6 fungal-type domain-containing protein n=2 Tax=Aspergillus subgen. Circumdati TaxID=2720871 RepID=A0A7R7W858_ASPKA|nr:uncharacterized protein AKAW2_31475A [Aspergillus luchuensis]BCR98156.1 hypothetical protein AKAW2_31475A [Aspergillus luchuensis]